MFTLDIRADFSQQIKQLEDLKKNLSSHVIVPAMNEVMRDTKVVMVRRIADQFNIKQSEVRDAIPDPQKASVRLNRFTATLYGNRFGTSKRSLNLIHFLVFKGQAARARRAKRLAKAFGGRVSMDYQFQIRKGGSPFAMPGSFIGNQGRTIFRRVGAARYPIEPVQTVGVPQMFMAHSVQDVVQSSLPARFAEAFDRRMRFVLSTLKQ